MSSLYVIPPPPTLIFQWNLLPCLLQTLPRFCEKSCDIKFLACCWFSFLLKSLSNISSQISEPTKTPSLISVSIFLRPKLFFKCWNSLLFLSIYPSCPTPETLYLKKHQDMLDKKRFQILSQQVNFVKVQLKESQKQNACIDNSAAFDCTYIGA